MSGLHAQTKPWHHSHPTRLAFLRPRPSRWSSSFVWLVRRSFYWHQGEWKIMRYMVAWPTGQNLTSSYLGARRKIDLRTKFGVVEMHMRYKTVLCDVRYNEQLKWAHHQSFVSHCTSFVDRQVHQLPSTNCNSLCGVYHFSARAFRTILCAELHEKAKPSHKDCRRRGSLEKGRVVEGVRCAQQGKALVPGSLVGIFYYRGRSAKFNGSYRGLRRE